MGYVHVNHRVSGHSLVGTHRDKTKKTKSPEKTKENLYNRFSLQLTSAMCCKAVHRSGQHSLESNAQKRPCPLRGSLSATYHIHVEHLCPLSSCSTWSKSLCTLLQNHTANAKWDCCSFHEELKTAACQPDVKKSHIKYGGGVFVFFCRWTLCTSSQCVQTETIVL